MPRRPHPHRAGHSQGGGACPVDSATFDAAAYSEVDCFHTVTHSGSLTIGKTTVQISHPVTVDFGVAITGGDNLTVAGQNWIQAQPEQIPGGLLGLAFGIQGTENAWPGVSDVQATVEPAGQPTGLNATGILGDTSTPTNEAPRLPVKIHLTNLLLGPHCYIGSNSDPILLRASVHSAGGGQSHHATSSEHPDFRQDWGTFRGR